VGFSEGVEGQDSVMGVTERRGLVKGWKGGIQ